MKKLLTILAATTATLFAFGSVPAGATVNQGADFEGYTSGSNFVWRTADDGKTLTGDRYWFTMDEDASNVISNYSAEAYSGVESSKVPIASRPDLFAENANTNFLQIETTGKLYRTVKPCEASGDFTNNLLYAFSIVDKPIYLDTLVKFTAADSAFGDDALADGDKIAISYVEHESEGGDDPAYTNFVIRAGYLSSPVVATNYAVKVPANFNKDDWHRLTVRTIDDIDGNNHVGFIVYLDGVALEYEDSTIDAGSFTATGVAANFYKQDYHALYPSFVQGGDFQHTISAAAFSGNGSLDDVVFTTTTPKFIEQGEKVRAEIALGTGVSAVAVTVDGTPVYAEAESTSTNKIFYLEAGTTNFVLSVTADTANGYAFNETNGITWVGAVYYYDCDTDTVSFPVGASPKLMLTATRNNFNLFDAGGAPISGTFQTLGAALAATGVAKIQLAHDYDVTDADLYNGSIYIEQSTTLDLNGKTLDGGESVYDPLFIVNDGNLVIVDSVGGGKVVYEGPGIVYGTSYIGATSGDLGPTFDGKLFFEGGEGSVIRGKFEKATNGAAAFAWTDYIAEGSALGESVGSYWIVEPQGTPQPTTYALTLPTVTGATAVVTDGGVEVADIAAIAENTAVVVTWTATEGYKITAGETENITMDSDKTAATPTVVAITYATLTITQVANCTIVVSNATAEVASGTTFDVDDAVVLTVYRTPAEGYELDGCAATETITMDQDQTVTAAVKQSGGSNWPSTWNSGNEPASMVTAFNTWIGVAGNDPTAANAEAAFLVGVNLADYTNDLAVASITLADGKVVITGNYNLSSVNGALAVKMGNAPNALGEPTAVTATEGAISLTPALGETKKFYQLVIGYPAN